MLIDLILVLPLVIWQEKSNENFDCSCCEFSFFEQDLGCFYDASENNWKKEFVQLLDFITKYYSL